MSSSAEPPADAATAPAPATAPESNADPRAFHFTPDFDFSHLPTMPAPQWIWLGDSLTMAAFNGNNSNHFHHRFLSRYVNKLDCVCRGYGGYQSAFSLAAAAAVMPSEPSPTHPIRAVSIWLGANDCSLPPLPCVPIAVFLDNITRIIRLVRARCPGADIILITPPPANIPFRQARRLKLQQEGAYDPYPDTRTEENGLFYVERLRELFSQLPEPTESQGKIALADVYQGFVDDGRSLDELLADGLHISDEGYKIVEDVLNTTIERDLPQLMPENLFSLFPSSGVSVQAWKAGPAEFERKFFANLSPERHEAAWPKK